MSIEIQNLNKKLGTFSLKDISFHLEESDYLKILGPSGSGKSTLLDCLLGVQTPDSGKISVHGQVINAWPIEKRNMAIVYQDFMLFPHLNVLNNVLFGLKMKKIPRKDQRAKEILEVLGILSLENRSIQTLSGGEKQRVALARALVLRPSLLLLDEPLNALDFENKLNVLEVLKTIQKEFKTPILHVTHDPEEGKDLTKKIAFLRNGILTWENQESLRMFSSHEG